nr:MAG TPA: hypothetical protein [Caudoviricetes sp.]
MLRPDGALPAPGSASAGRGFSFACPQVAP